MVYRLGEGTRRPADDVALDPDVPADRVAEALDDLLHEYARPGHEVRPLGP